MNVSAVRPLWAFAAACLCLANSRADDAPSSPATLEARLKAESPETLTKAAREQGDPARGALLFHRPELLCARCHIGGGTSPTLGPDLSRVEKGTVAADLIESILDPSKVIKKGYETVTIATKDGKTFSGLLAEDRPDAVALRDPAKDGQLVVVPKADIEARAADGPSIMPAGLVNALTSRQQFLDLARYVIEVSEKGPGRALELRPDPSLIAPPLPEYEKHVDHAGLIASLDRKSVERGEAIYGRVCANCHGTRDKVGSMPTSLRFASGIFKNGADPFRLYQTLTLGHGQMPPQTWMVPSQKYDVIHYIREAYLKGANPTQYVAVDPAYLASLPKGDTRGPAPTAIEPWLAMDYGPSMALTLEVGEDGSNIAYKGVAIRLDDGPGGIARGKAWALYEHDTMRLAAFWTGDSFIDWNGINFTGKHEVHPRIVGKVHLANSDGPGWADFATGRFDDPRLPARDGRRYGPMPRNRLRYRGLYHAGKRVILSYAVGSVEILEWPGLEIDLERPDAPIFTRTLEIEESPNDLWMRVAPKGVHVAIAHGGLGPIPELVERDGSTLLHVPASSKGGRGSLAVQILATTGDLDRLRERAEDRVVAPTLLRRSGVLSPVDNPAVDNPSRWSQVLATKAVLGDEAGPFAADTLTPPDSNPWLALLRFSGLDYFRDCRRAALCTWDGDVWIVDGLDNPAGALSWRRIASGLFQPLGLKIILDQVYVSCRDQIVSLRDLNGDGETDFYECFNTDHQVTDSFHEFAMGLQTDSSGNFYYTKAARHGKTAVVPQHGTLLRVGPSGSLTEILATGFRAPNGVLLNPDGTFFVTDQEGHWIPKNRINWVRPGHFYGNMWGYHDVTDTSDSAMDAPLCWITNAVDRSPAELVRVESAKWGALNGSLLNLSYGTGKVFVVPFEKVGDRMQGGVSALPIPSFPTGVMRGRFHPKDGQLYVCGLYGWAGNQTQPGGFYRIRATGKPAFVPIELKAQPKGMALTFAALLDPKAAADPSRYSVMTWSLKRAEQYGSKHYDEHPSAVLSATVSDDGRSVSLEIAGFRPVDCMEIKYALKGADGTAVDGQVDNTIHRVPD